MLSDKRLFVFIILALVSMLCCPGFSEAENYTYDSLNRLTNGTSVGTTYTVTTQAGTNGAISPGTTQTVNYNATASFTIIPSADYQIATVTGCGGTLAGNIYTTGPITGNCTVSASFALETLTVSPSAQANGSISPSVPQSVTYGSMATFTVAPAADYQIASVTGCGGTLAGNIYTTGPITGNCTVSASFALETLTVSPSAGANGSISPSVPQTVTYGSTATFTITPAANYQIASVTGCGGGTLMGNTYTTAAVTANCAVTATFLAGNYTIMIEGTTPQYFTTLQAAYNAAVNGSVIKLQAGSITGNLNVNQNISVSLSGGYDSSFSTYAGNTTLTGIIQTYPGGGALTIKNFILTQ